MKKYIPNVLADLVNVLNGSLATWKDVVGTILLVGSDEVRVVDAGKRSHLSHLLLDLGLQGWLEDCSTIHGLSHVHTADVPTTNDEVIGVNHWKDVLEGNVDILGGLSVGTKLDSGTHDEGAIVVGRTRTFTSVPGDTTAIGNDTSSDCGTVVTTPANKHHTGLGDFAINLEIVDSLLGSSYELAISRLGDESGAVGVLGADLVVGVDNIGRFDSE